MSRKGFTLVELMIVVVILGILASIAIPLYMKFVQQAKAGEARLNLGKIGSLTEAYYNSKREAGRVAALEAGTVIAGMVAAFPRCTTSDTDCTDLCGESDTPVERVPMDIAVVSGGGKYLPSESDWFGQADTRAWAKIPFAILQPIQYQYCFAGTNSGTLAWFNSSAWGDVDGDGNRSHFWRLGTVNNGAVLVSPVAVQNEVE